ncbi:creatininase family protein [Peteryoungia desertarenae]|uniref:Creatininase family protein n=1 Tax=Peteryoungia desertarenae TaxID=1813451 RepID=A0ABX6QIQ6_9HYPH|nr:creatininase family protein [Peteryoungia desertarenae]QLF68162.1 creatininase family protein [Peteryoungia desertarenae]
MNKPRQVFMDNDFSLPPATRANWIAILPLGAHEQHGPHLPFETDSIIAAGVAERLAISLPQHLPATFLPVEPVGYSIEHLDVTGTKSLDYAEAVERWLKIAKELHDRGIGKLVLLNAHGGNSPLLTIVATEARIRFNMLVVATSWTRFGVPPHVITPEEKAIDIHAGDIETSVMLALRPDLVDMAKAGNFSSRQSEFVTRFTHLRAYGPHAFGWKMSDLNEKGAAGNALLATSAKGEALLDHAVNALIELLEDVHAFDVSDFNRQPKAPQQSL